MRPYERPSTQVRAAVVSGVYNGGTVNIPMTGVTPPTPLGGPRMPPRTAPEFDVFVVQKQ